MILEFPSEDASLAAFLHARAFTASPRRLALDIAVGAVALAAAAWQRPHGWVIIASAAACFAMYGTWAIAERKLEMQGDSLSRSSEFAWTLLRAVAALIGLSAALLCTFAIAATAMGSWTL
jgi:hypothetical protein